MHFAKSECPTPKGGIDNARKGHTQARFFSRKNSNQNIMIASQNGGMQGNQGSYSNNNSQSRHNFSPQ